MWTLKEFCLLRGLGGQDKKATHVVSHLETQQLCAVVWCQGVPEAALRPSHNLQLPPHRSRLELLPAGATEEAVELLWASFLFFPGK